MSHFNLFLSVCSLLSLSGAVNVWANPVYVGGQKADTEPKTVRYDVKAYSCNFGYLDVTDANLEKIEKECAPILAVVTPTYLAKRKQIDEDYSKPITSEQVILPREILTGSFTASIIESFTVSIDGLIPSTQKLRAVDYLLPFSYPVSHIYAIKFNDTNEADAEYRKHVVIMSKHGLLGDSDSN